MEGQATILFMEVQIKTSMEQENKTMTQSTSMVMMVMTKSGDLMTC